MSREIRRIALLTAGGYAPCLSSAVGGLIERYSQVLPDAEIIGYLHGYHGVLAGNYLVVDQETRDKAHLLHDFGGGIDRTAEVEEALRASSQFHPARERPAESVDGTRLERTYNQVVQAIYRDEMRRSREEAGAIARGERIWCLGYSEPGAGSDLASLQMRCEDKGDHWLINGSKIWTSGAQFSRYGILLARTDPDFQAAERGDPQDGSPVCALGRGRHYEAAAPEPEVPQFQ